MRNDKNKAISLRKKGNSYNQINSILNVPKSTLSVWLKDIKLSDKARNKIDQRAYSKSVSALIKRNKNQTILAENRAIEIMNSSKMEVSKHIKDILFVSGVSLYWAEGYKKGAYGSKWKSVDFANSDPQMIKLIIKFFQKYLNIPKEKIKIQIIAHENIDINKSIEYWAKLTDIPKEQFVKSTINTSHNRNSKNRRKNNTLTYGTIHVRINDVKLFFKMIGWIEGLKNYFNI